MTLKQLLQRTYQNLQILQERQAGYGDHAPLDLLNQIRDHRTAIDLINQALAGPQTEKTIKQLKDNLRPLLVAVNVELIDLAQLKPEKPRLPFEPEIILIPDGPFWMGSQPDPHISPEQTPQHPVEVAAFRLGKYPITNAQYAVFIQHEAQQAVPKKAGWFLREPPADRLDHPVVSISWHDALAYCRWLSHQTGRNYRLPTEAEWEKAAAWDGEQSRRYPWGDAFDPTHVNMAETGLNGTTPVVQYSPRGDSFFGCAGMADNVQEWVSTLWGSDPAQTDYPYPYRQNDGREDLSAGQRLHRTYRIYRGGSFRDSKTRAVCQSRGWSDPDSKLRWRGFRVAADIE